MSGLTGEQIFGDVWNEWTESEQAVVLSELESNFWEPWFRSAFVTIGG